MNHKIFRLITSLFLALAVASAGSSPALAAPPANDNFANAQVITSLPFTATVDNTDATTEPDEPFIGVSGNTHTVWYAFTPTENVAARLDMTGSLTSGMVNVYLSSGPGFADLTFFTGASQATSRNINFEAGKTYYFQVGDAFGQIGIVQLNLEQIFPPANDNFANAEAITSLPFSATVDNTNATAELGESFNCGFTNTLWYSFTPAQNMAVRMDMLGGAVPGILSVYLSSGPGFSNLTFLGCDETLNFNVEAGKTYYLQISSNRTSLGVLQLNLQQIFPPANDNFANAEVITSLPFSVTVDNTDATHEPDEPSNCGLNNSLWYSFTPTQNMAVRIDMLGSAVSGILGVYLSSGPGLSNLTLFRCVFSNPSPNFYFEAGKTYYLRVMGNGQAGVLQLNLEQIFPPANDNFANAEAITSLPFSATVDNTDATNEPGEPSGCGFTNTLWYSFTPAQNMAVRVDMLGGAIPGILSTYLSSGPGFSNLTLLGCANNTADFNFEAGKTYYLQVDGDFRQIGVIQVNMEQISSATTVMIDIKPGRFPNRIKLRRNVCRDDDNVYIAILTTPSFNARTVDVSSLQLGDPNLSGKATPIKSRITDVDRDGDRDMVLTFTLCSIVTNGAINLNSTEMVLIGTTLEGVSITGRDSVKIVSDSYP